MADRVGHRASREVAALPLVALGAFLATTVLWWAFALWPLPAAAPAWAERARAVCFGTGADGLPDASGWLALVLQPAVVGGALAVLWGREIAAAVSTLAKRAGGRAALAACGLALAVGIGAAVLRVQGASESPPGAGGTVAPVRLEAPVPPLPLVDQRGEPFSWADFGNRPVFVAFAFGHCETVCPLVVRSALDARDAAPGPRPAVVVVTLDPWRDTPSRLAALADRWGLGPGDRALSGPVETVEAALDAWGIARSRDRRTGDLVHPAVTFVVGPGGSPTWRTAGDEPTLVALADRIAARGR